MMTKSQEFLTVAIGCACIAVAMIGFTALANWASRPTDQAYIDEFTQRVHAAFSEVERMELLPHQKYMRLAMELTTIRLDIAMRVEGNIEVVRSAIDALIVQLKEEYGYTTV